MKLAIVKNGIVENIVVVVEQADSMVPIYDGIQIGGIYDPNNTIPAQLNKMVDVMTKSIEEGLLND